MPKYHYHAVDAQGRRVAGDVDAPDAAEALRRLGAMGLQAQGGDIEELAELREVAEPEQLAEREEAVGPVEAGARLTAEETVDVGQQLAELAKAGMPLGPGLRAMAAEMSRRCVARMLRRLADRLDAGASLEEALTALGKRFPAHLRGLLLAGVRTGRVSEAMEEFVALENTRLELRRRVRLSMAYPCVLLVSVVVLLAFICTSIIPGFRTIFDDFGAELPALTRLIVVGGTPEVALALVVFGAAVLAVVAWMALSRSVSARRLLYWVPWIGPVSRWAGLFRFCRLASMLLEQQVPLPEAFRLAAAGLREADLSAACREAARTAEAGASLSESLAGRWQFPAGLRHLAEWGERTSNPAAAFQAAAEMFDTRLRIRNALLESVLPPLVYLFVLLTIGLVVIALMTPLVSLIQNLT
jgi:type II secretory pathway component PulF